MASPSLGVPLRICGLSLAALVVLAGSGGASAQAQDLDGRWVPEGGLDGCAAPAFVISGDTLTPDGGAPWGIADDGLLLTVEPPADCVDCERAPFDIMPDGSLQRFVEGDVTRFVNCDAAEPPELLTALGPAPGQEPATDGWTLRSVEDSSEAFFSTGETTLVVGCRSEPATAYVRYYPRRGFRFTEVATPRGRVNILIGTRHPEFGAFTSTHTFRGGVDGLRVYYEGAWSAGDPFFVREEGFRLIAGLRTGVDMSVEAPTVFQETGERAYEDRFTLQGSAPAIAEAMRTGGCGGFLAATEQAIRAGAVQ